MSPIFTARVTTPHPDLAEAFFDNAGAVAQAIGLPQNGRTRIDAYFTAAPEFGDLPFAHEDFALEQVPDEDWVTRSQQNLPPVSVPPFFLFGRHDRPHRRRARYQIEMDAGLAFGSGHHATTQGCLHLLADVLKIRRPAHAADIGTGAGTLAIALAKAGCRNIFASDTDPQAVRVAQQNFKINGLAANIRPVWCTGLHHHQARQAAPFDLITANILAAPLIAMASDIAAHMAPHGQLILSGLLHAQKKPIVARYRDAGLTLQKDICIGPWTSLMFRR
jgi:ribosomal protein L11 methyltransferase